MPDIRRIHQNFLKFPISSIFTHVTSVFDLQPSFDLRTFISVLGLSIFELLHCNVLRYFLFFQTGCSFFPPVGKDLCDLYLFGGKTITMGQIEFGNHREGQYREGQ